MNRIGTFLITVALIVGMVSCSGATRYNLTMAVAGGNGTATDLTNTSPYTAGTVVSIKAVAAAGYYFANWSAPAGTFADPNAAETTFTMPAQNVAVTASFVPPNHFMYYAATGSYIGENVTLEDQFGTVNATVRTVWCFGNPAEEFYGNNWTPIHNPDDHFTLYTVSCDEFHYWQVAVNNEFGMQNLIVYGPIGLAVPAQKMEPGGHEMPVALDHYLLYQSCELEPIMANVDLYDEFGSRTGVTVRGPEWFANPVRKTHGGNVTEIVNPDLHAVIYRIFSDFLGTTVKVADQFCLQNLSVAGPYRLAVKSETADWRMVCALNVSGTKGGRVTTPGEGLFPYEPGTVVDLVATPDAGYHFVNWTGDVGTIANVNAPATNITMDGSYSITANFEL